MSVPRRDPNLYDLLAPEGKRVGPQGVGAGFVERGITLDGVMFILMCDPANFEAGTSIVAIAPFDRVIGLDDKGARRPVYAPDGIVERPL